MELLFSTPAILSPSFDRDARHECLDAMLAIGIVFVRLSPNARASTLSALQQQYVEAAVASV